MTTTMNIYITINISKIIKNCVLIFEFEKNLLTYIISFFIFGKSEPFIWICEN